MLFRVETVVATRRAGSRGWDPPAQVEPTDSVLGAPAENRDSRYILDPQSHAGKRKNNLARSESIGDNFKWGSVG